MLHSTSSGTDMLLRSQYRTSHVHNLRKSGNYHQGSGRPSCPRRHPGHASHPEAPYRTAGGPRPATPGLSLGGPCQQVFENISASESIAGGGIPTVASGAVGQQEALFGFFLRESNNTAVRWQGDDCDEQDYI
ncbi:hypothetical protein MRX96_045218 [Rhipicephalus microplus]